MDSIFIFYQELGQIFQCGPLKGLNVCGLQRRMSYCYCDVPLQGLMFGYATDETEESMPLTIILAHKLNAKMAELRRKGVLPWLRPDSKTQVAKRWRRPTLSCFHLAVFFF